MNIEITKATVVLSNMADKIILDTNLPSSMPNVTIQNVVLSFDAAYNTGVKYVNDNFNMMPRIVDRIK